MGPCQHFLYYFDAILIFFVDYMGMSEEEEITKFNLRIPTALYESLGRRAVKNRRSLNNEIIVILERYEAAEESLQIPDETSRSKIG